MHPIGDNTLPGWPEDQAPTVRQLIDIIESQFAERKFGWTGRARPEWKLETTLDRRLKDLAPTDSSEQWLAHEQALIQEFRSLALPYADQGEAGFLSGTRLATLALGQHSGLPTRLLDWTTNPWIAAWFACHEHSDVDGILWWFDYNRLEDEVGKHWDFYTVPLLDPRDIHRDLEGATFISKGAPWISKLHVSYQSPRMSAQHAFHTFSGRLRWTHNDAIDSLAARSHGRGISRGRIRIAAAMKGEVLDFLCNKKNIDAARLMYPGVDNAARFLARR